MRSPPPGAGKGGGSRSQSVRRTSPGAHRAQRPRFLRIDRETPAPGRTTTPPLASPGREQPRRIIGLPAFRKPHFRFTIRTGTRTKSGSPTSVGTTGKRSTASTDPTTGAEHDGWPRLRRSGIQAGSRPQPEPLHQACLNSGGIFVAVPSATRPSTRSWTRRAGSKGGGPIHRHRRKLTS